MPGLPPRTSSRTPSSGAAPKRLNSIWPDLKITGKAYRVPVGTGSIAEVNVVVNRSTTVEEVVGRVPQRPPMTPS